MQLEWCQLQSAHTHQSSTSIRETNAVGLFWRLPSGLLAITAFDSEIDILRTLQRDGEMEMKARESKGKERT